MDRKSIAARAQNKRCCISDQQTKGLYDHVPQPFLVVQFVLVNYAQCETKSNQSKQQTRSLNFVLIGPQQTD